MASFTRKAIMEAFIRLLEDRPLNKITVKDIVEECGINRNTFYYHFADIPALVEEIVREQVEQVVRENGKVSSIEECINIAIAFIQRYRKSTLHIYQSVNRDIYERYLMKMCGDVVQRFFDTAFGPEELGELDRSVLIQAYKCQCFGLFIDWLNGGLQDGFHQRMLRLCELRKGMLEEIIRRNPQSGQKG